MEDRDNTKKIFENIDQCYEQLMEAKIFIDKINKIGLRIDELKAHRKKSIQRICDIDMDLNKLFVEMNMIYLANINAIPNKEHTPEQLKDLRSSIMWEIDKNIQTNTDIYDETCSNCY